MVCRSVHDGIRFVLWVIVAFLICYYSSYVSPYYEIPREGDAIIYSLMGRGMVEGLVPYRDLFDQKGPLIFLIYGFSYALCGSYWLVFVLEVFAVIVSMAFCYKAALLFVSRRKAFIVSLLVIYSLCNFHCYGGGGHPAGFVLPFQFAAAYGVCRLHRHSGHFIKTGIAFGVGIGVALLLKFNLAAFWCVPCVYVMARAWKEGKAWSFAAAVCGSLAVTLVPCFWYFYSRGALRDLYEGYVVFNVGYGAVAESLEDVCMNYAKWVKRDAMYPGMLMYAVGLLGVVLSRMSIREKGYYAAAFLITCVGVQGNGKMHCSHYAQTLIPFASVGYLIAARMVHVGDVVSQGGRRWLFPLSVAGLVAYTLLNCINFSLRGPARGGKSPFVFPDGGEGPGIGESCAAIGRYAVWFYQANGLPPPVRTFTICASDEQGEERERMRQCREICNGKMDCVVIAGEYFKPDKREYPSLRAMQDLLNTEYRLEQSVSDGEMQMELYRRVRKD